VLRVIHAAASQVASTDVSDRALAELVDSQRKPEVVLGRLWGTVGEDMLRCPLALRLNMPNEAHLLAALHLARGGMHVTLNFDVGIKLAHNLLTGRAELPPEAPHEYRRFSVNGRHCCRRQRRRCASSPATVSLPPGWVALLGMMFTTRSSLRQQAPGGR